MMAGTAIFHRLAAREYRLARDWYTSRSAGVGKRFTAAVGDAIARIEQSPERILVVAVAHARRRPGYWRRRG